MDWKQRYSGKLPVGYKNGNQFLCLNCAHHLDIIHNGFKPTTRGNIKNCIRCGEEEKPKTKG